jgi:hypothetical protein
MIFERYDIRKVEMNDMPAKGEKKEFNGISCHDLPCDYWYVASINDFDKVLTE